MSPISEFFSAREYDPLLQMYYYRARFYDPHLGRFISQDPQGFLAGDANLYRFVANSPVNGTDPSGQDIVESALFYAKRGALVGALSGAICGYLEATASKQNALAATVLGALSGALGGAVGGLLGPLSTVSAPFAVVAAALTVIGVAETHEYLVSSSSPTQFWFRTGCIAASVTLGYAVSRFSPPHPRGPSPGTPNSDGCFVAGTEVIMGLTAGPDLIATTGWWGRPNVWIAGLALLGGVSWYLALRRQKRKQVINGEEVEVPWWREEPTEEEMADVDMYFCQCDDEPEESPGDLLPVGAEETAMYEQAREEYFRTAAKEAPVASVATATLSAPAQRDKAPLPRKQAAAAKSKPEKRSGLLAKAGLVLGMLLAGIALGFPAWFNGVPSDAPAQTRLTKNIEDVRPGERVLAKLPSGMVAPPEVEVDPPNWRYVVLRAPKRDGSWAEVEGLRPVLWLRQQGAYVGGTVELSVPECGIEGWAEVVSIAPCPPIPPRLHPDDRLVLTIYRHIAGKVVNLFVEGEAEPIGVTGNHRFWSADRHDFVRADALQVGERFSGLDGQPPVVNVVPVPGRHTVYNLEVEGAHVYHVTGQGVLVHNAVPCPNRAAQLKANQAQGAAFERQVSQNLQQTQSNVQQQITVKTQSGTRTRLDFIAEEQGTGNLALTEAKSSATAPLTPNQTKAFPEIAATGATVVGQGKPGFPGGTQIPPTPVNIIRP